MILIRDIQKHCTNVVDVDHEIFAVVVLVVVDTVAVVDSDNGGIDVDADDGDEKKYHQPDWPWVDVTRLIYY